MHHGIATAVAPETGLTDVQAELLHAIASALTGFDVDYRALEPLGPDELADVLAGTRPRATASASCTTWCSASWCCGRSRSWSRTASRSTRKRSASRTTSCASPRRYAQGAYGLAWMDLQRSGFVEHVRERRRRRSRDARGRSHAPLRSSPRRSIPRSRRGGPRSPSCPHERSATRSGRCTTAAGSSCPARPAARPPYLAQHDFVHVLADYGTNLKGELEVFALIGRADPDPKGFAWLATLIGLFETGYITEHRLLRPRRPRAPRSRRRACTCARRRDPARQGGLRSATASTCSRSTTTRSRRGRSTRSARCSACRRSRPARSPPARSALFDSSRACRRRSGEPSQQRGEAIT